ncbi:MAG: UDP-3-O-(3-hydroxymyristoyl)glucosamine N-acyltransferase [Coxiellaceae bacterium]|nr:UDP-3-O-(3-hydroxymyristoyl)glucosamine N-acyltransferase [Coxiellaceae bacterium]
MPTSLYTVSELAQRFSLEYRGDGSHLIDGVGTLLDAGPTQLSFLSNKKYAKQLPETKAGVVILTAEAVDACATNALIAKDPYVSYAKIAALFEVKPAIFAGIHPTAVIATSAKISDSVSIGPYCVIEENAVIEVGVILGSHCIVGENCVVGAASRLVSRVTLVTRVTLGKRVLIHPGVVIGADGFGLAMDAGKWIKVPQLGGVRIGDDCEIGANTCIDRGALEDTVLAEDVRLDNQIQIGHNVSIGAHTAIAGSTGIAGSTKVGRYCIIGGHVGIAGHLEIVDGVSIAGKSGVAQSITEKGQYSSSIPVQEVRQWFRNVMRLRELDKLAKRVAELAKMCEKTDE